MSRSSIFILFGFPMAHPTNSLVTLDADNKSNETEQKRQTFQAVMQIYMPCVLRFKQHAPRKDLNSNVVPVHLILLLNHNVTSVL